jgi:hypothetical protein
MSRVCSSDLLRLDEVEPTSVTAGHVGATDVIVLSHYRNRNMKKKRTTKHVWIMEERRVARPLKDHCAQ